MKAYRELIRLYHLARYPEYRLKDDTCRRDFQAFCDDGGGFALRQDFTEGGKARKLALVVRNISFGYAKIEAVLMKTLQMAGFETVVLSKRQFEFLRYEWLVGNETGYTLDDFAAGTDEAWIERELPRQRTLSDWLALQYEGVSVGRIVLATTLRQLKVGSLNFDDPVAQRKLREMLTQSVANARAADRLLRTLRPDCVLFMDRGYSGQGEISDVALNLGIDTLTWNVGHKGNRLVFRRYTAASRREHPLTPSPETWQRVLEMPWKPEYGDEVRRELFECYESQDWFSGQGTQFDKKILSREETMLKLGLSTDKKVAVIFPHILWDGSFFFGEDLFDNYTHWLIETIRAAIANDRVQWVVKVHPAHIIKAKVEGDRNTAAEIVAIENEFKTLPGHIKLVFPDTDLSTYSMFQIADYTVTVRGTVGIESPVFGVPTITAGTGRYDGRGFTVDSSSSEEYLQRLATLETIPRLTPAQRELAERYAYTVFLGRPFRLSSVSLTYDRDGMATPRVTVKCRKREEWLSAPDLAYLAKWFGDGKTEEMLFLPEG